ncbi:zinc transporter ZIP1-like [Pollicipes pollicipes]|uniref:zinc transporter ZIP1-like n=1 Tax=Pollicipes pollicipes TaxID=41117 RepID=UPI0018850E77|nr:zinc transporter ZIP1-like [Pollicipes pollicipes]
MSLLAAKLGGLIVLLGCTLLLGLLPFALQRWLQRYGDASGQARAQLGLSCMQCFGSGLLLATVFAHLLPEVRAGLAVVQPDDQFPLAEVLLCAGFFSIYAIEELVELALQRGGRPALAANLAPSAKPGYGALESTAGSGGGGSGGGSGGGNGGGGGGGRHDRLSGLRVLVVTVALSVHSVFEGMAVGLETRVASVWVLVTAITTHKSIIAFCLGEQLAASGQPLRRALVTLLVFVLASPTGVLLGLLATDGGSGGSDAVLTNLLQALAAGSILYVVVFEILQGERAKPGSGLAKLAAVLLGFLAMLLVTTLV